MGEILEESFADAISEGMAYIGLARCATTATSDVYCIAADRRLRARIFIQGRGGVALPAHLCWSSDIA